MVPLALRIKQWPLILAYLALHDWSLSVSLALSPALSSTLTSNPPNTEPTSGLSTDRSPGDVIVTPTWVEGSPLILSGCSWGFMSSSRLSVTPLSESLPITDSQSILAFYTLCYSSRCVIIYLSACFMLVLICKMLILYGTLIWGLAQRRCTVYTCQMN